VRALWKKVRGEKPRKVDRREAWQEVARSIGSTFVEGKRPSADTISIAHGPWTITLDTYTVHTGQASVTYTRAKALFIAEGDPKFRIRRRNFFDTILENIGLGGVVLGDPAFAARYVMKGRPEARLRSLQTAGFVEALLAAASLTVSVGKAPGKYRRVHGPQAREATVVTTSVIKDPHRLVNMIEVAKETVTALQGAGWVRLPLAHE
jgi:hypothetical protein